MNRLKNLLKNILSHLGIFLSLNQRYDWQLRRIIKVIQPGDKDIVLIDIGAHKGEVTDMTLKFHQGIYLLFEPIPKLYQNLLKQYQGRKNIHIYELGLADEKGSSTFHYNHTHPAYSGIKKRSYPSGANQVEEITIVLDTLDNVMQAFNDIEGVSLIKIDVEGGELGVLHGATETIQKYKPLVVFEHGLGASEFYATRPEDIYQFFTRHNMSIQTMEVWLKKKSPGMNPDDFTKQFYNKSNYYFIAYPNN